LFEQDAGVASGYIRKQWGWEAKLVIKIIVS